jgi:hypothetical protein
MPTSLTPAQRRLRAKIAANERWSGEDPVPNALRASAGLKAKFLREVDPDGLLEEAERQRRARAAYVAHMQRLAYLSVKARAARKAAP